MRKVFQGGVALLYVVEAGDEAALEVVVRRMDVVPQDRVLFAALQRYGALSAADEDDFLVVGDGKAHPKPDFRMVFRHFGKQTDRFMAGRFDLVGIAAQSKVFANAMGGKSGGNDGGFKHAVVAHLDHGAVAWLGD